MRRSFGRRRLRSQKLYRADERSRHGPERRTPRRSTCRCTSGSGVASATAGLLRIWAPSQRPLQRPSSCPARPDRLPARLEAPEKSHRCRGFFFSSIPYLALERRVLSIFHFPFVIFVICPLFVIYHLSSRRDCSQPLAVEMTNG